MGDFVLGLTCGIQVPVVSSGKLGDSGSHIFGAMKLRTIAVPKIPALAQSAA